MLAKWNTPSWNAKTRDVVAARMMIPDHPRFLSAPEWAVADALCRRILPQASGKEAVSLVVLLDAKLLADQGDGFREADMPYMQGAWQRGLALLNDEAVERHGSGFADLAVTVQDSLLSAMHSGEIKGERWDSLPAKAFFERRILVDVPALYYSLPKAWSEIGFGGPASPRGYVRLDGDRLDPWEAAEATPGKEQCVEQESRHVV